MVPDLWTIPLDLSNIYINSCIDLKNITMELLDEFEANESIKEKEEWLKMLEEA